MTSRSERRMAWGANLVSEMARFDAEIAPDLWMFAGFGNVGVAMTAEGLVVMDTSGRAHAIDIIKRLRAKTQAPVHTIILTHGHGDHIGGLGIFLKDAEERGHRKPLIIAHELVPVRFNRYKMTSGYQLNVNMIQYGGALEQSGNINISRPQFLFPDIAYPDITYHDAMQFKLGGLTFELYHAEGETDDHTWIYIPERKTVIAGDACKEGMPNIGNPFKLMLRYETEWAESMELIAGKNPEFVIPGHGSLMDGAAAREVCLEQAAFLRWLHDEVIGMMNRGCWLEEILETIKMPEKWAGKPYLHEIYGCLNFVIHGIYNRYGGWYNGHPADLFPSKRSEIAAEVLKVSGADKLMKEADFVADGVQDKTLRKTAHLLRAKILDARANIETNGMVKNTLLRAAVVSEKDAQGQ